MTRFMTRNAALVFVKSSTSGREQKIEEDQAETAKRSAQNIACYFIRMYQGNAEETKLSGYRATNYPHKILFVLSETHLNHDN